MPPRGEDLTNEAAGAPHYLASQTKILPHMDRNVRTRLDMALARRRPVCTPLWPREKFATDEPEEKAQRRAHRDLEGKKTTACRMLPKTQNNRPKGVKDRLTKEGMCRQ